MLFVEAYRSDSRACADELLECAGRTTSQTSSITTADLWPRPAGDPWPCDVDDDHL